MIRVSRSFIDAQALADVIDREYDFSEPVQCKLFSKMLRTQDNDHYKVIVGDEKYVARVYQLGKHLRRQESDYQWELSWLEYLRDNGLPVSYPVRRRDGGFLGSVRAPEGSRFYALFSFARGNTMSVRNLDQLYRCGAEMARIHVISNAFNCPYERQPMDLDFLLDRSVAGVQAYWGSDPDKQDSLEILLTSAEEARSQIMDLLENEETTADSWGPIGGDFHTVSTYFDRQGRPTFFNFDLCGPGWRAYDIASFLLNTNLMQQAATDQSEAFFAGYYSERRLSRNEHEAISPFLTIRRIWLTAAFTMGDGLAGHTFIGPA